MMTSAPRRWLVVAALSAAACSVAGSANADDPHLSMFKRGEAAVARLIAAHYPARRPPSLEREVARSGDLGLPTAASKSNPNDLLFARKGFVGSYNSARREPNWIEYKVDRKDYGRPAFWLPRVSPFRPDPFLPATVHQAALGDYAGSGFDRGHEKRAWDAPLRIGHLHANFETFLLTNVVPQAPNVNRGPWNHFEDFYQHLAMKEHKEVRVVIGNLYEGPQRSIGANHVAVPSHCFKIITVSAPGTRVADMNVSNTKVYAVLMPNDDKRVGADDHFAKYLVSPQEIVRRSGFTGILANVPPAARGDLLAATVTAERTNGGYSLGGRLVPDPPPHRWSLEQTPEPQ